MEPEFTFCHFRCKMTKNAFLGPKKAKIKESEESGPKLFLDLSPNFLGGLPWH